MNRLLATTLLAWTAATGAVAATQEPIQPPAAQDPAEPPPEPPAPSPPSDPAVVEAERRLAERPDSPERLYNLGVALFRAGDRTRAAERFRESATRSRSADLAARAMYNEGVAAYADAVEALEKSGDGSSSSDPAAIEELTKRVESAFTHFRDAATANPSDREARGNAENARELIKLLKQAQQQQDQQKQDQQQQDQQKQDQQKQDQQKQDQQKQDQQQQDQQQQDQQQQDQQQQDQQQQDQQQQDQQQQDQQQQDQQKQDQQKQDQQKQDQQKEPGGDEPSSPDRKRQGSLDRSDEPPPEGQAKPAAAEASPGTMTKEEAERLLQAVRDRERARRAALAEKVKAERARTPPARKDW